MTIDRCSIDRRELIKAGVACGLVAVVPLALRAQSSIGPASPISAARVKQILEALQLAGDSLPPADVGRLLALAAHSGPENVAEIEAIFNRYTLIRVRLDRHGFGASSPGGAALEIKELGWRSFLVRVENPGELTGPLVLVNNFLYSPPLIEGQLQNGLHDNSPGNDIPEIVRTPPDTSLHAFRLSVIDEIASDWLGYRFGVEASPTTELAGLPIEYLLIQLYSQVGGTRSRYMAACSAAVPFIRRPECTGFTAEFHCHPAREVALSLHDADGRGVVASLLVHDEQGRLYPAPAHRLEPDLGYQPQVYRADGEILRLPPGLYNVIAWRGPEYLKSHCDLHVSSDVLPVELKVDLVRWIDPAQFGWYSGDPHIHPEGQNFGTVSSLGLVPETLFRQAAGEALSVASILIWSDGYYYQKQFLTGRVYHPTYRLPFPSAQRANNVLLIPKATPHDGDGLIRYDVEHVVFPSTAMGHPLFLRLQNHDYPGVRSINDWPSWNLPIFRWARAQGAITGYPHIGTGMVVGSDELPNYEIPEIPGLGKVGGSECLVDIAHGLVDFICGGECKAGWDLNFWYHVLNCGFLLPMLGESDFQTLVPRVGMVRTYFKHSERPVGDAGYDAWVEGIRNGRVYFGDGRSHLIDFRVNDREVGQGPLELSAPGMVRVTCRVAAWLDKTPVDPDFDSQTPSYAYWHLERARLGSSRRVPLEVILNGRPVQRCEVLADGALLQLAFEINLAHSSWIALRILPSAHTAAIPVVIRGSPIRVSRKSAQWCLECVEAFWKQFAGLIRASERAAAAAAWKQAGSVYRRIAAECSTE